MDNIKLLHVLIAVLIINDAIVSGSPKVLKNNNNDHKIDEVFIAHIRQSSNDKKNSLKTNNRSNDEIKYSGEVKLPLLQTYIPAKKNYESPTKPNSKHQIKITTKSSRKHKKYNDQSSNEIKEEKIHKKNKRHNKLSDQSSYDTEEKKAQTSRNFVTFFANFVTSIDKSFKEKHHKNIKRNYPLRDKKYSDETSYDTEENRNDKTLRKSYEIHKSKHDHSTRRKKHNNIKRHLSLRHKYSDKSSHDKIKTKSPRRHKTSDDQSTERKEHKNTKRKVLSRNKKYKDDSSRDTEENWQDKINTKLSRSHKTRHDQSSHGKEHKNRKRSLSPRHKIYSDESLYDTEEKWPDNINRKSHRSHKKNHNQYTKEKYHDKTIRNSFLRYKKFSDQSSHVTEEKKYKKIKTKSSRSYQSSKDQSVKGKQHSKIKKYLSWRHKQLSDASLPDTEEKRYDNIYRPSSTNHKTSHYQSQKGKNHYTIKRKLALRHGTYSDESLHKYQEKNRGKIKTTSSRSHKISHDQYATEIEHNKLKSNIALSTEKTYDLSSDDIKEKNKIKTLREHEIIYNNIRTTPTENLESERKLNTTTTTAKTVFKENLIKKENYINATLTKIASSNIIETISDALATQVLRKIKEKLNTTNFKGKPDKEESVETIQLVIGNEDFVINTENKSYYYDY